MFTVVIPIYNKAHTIQRTLKSVINQTFTHFEIIIIDDGSTDNSLEKINKFTHDTRIKIINQENQGVSVARNLGVENAKYEYIAFLDGDDKWELKYLETIDKAIKLHPNCGMFCCAGYFKNDLTKKTSLRLVDKYKEKIIEINYFKNPHVFSHTSATIVKKDDFNNAGGFPKGMKKNEDYALFFSIAIIKTVVYCGFPLSYYYGNVKGQSTTINRTNSYKSNLDVCKRINLTYKLWNTLGRKNKVFKVFLKYEYRHYILTALKQNDYKTVNLFLKNIDKGILNLFPYLEMKCYKIQLFKNWNQLYINATKLLWRIRGYPRVGK
jgi:glycosyltransferase involved in cell wall biosynthesis